MPKGYHHLTYEQRCQIFALDQSALSHAAIAWQIGVALQRWQSDRWLSVSNCGPAPGGE